MIDSTTNSVPLDWHKVEASRTAINMFIFSVEICWHSWFCGENVWILSLFPEASCSPVEWYWSRSSVIVFCRKLRVVMLSMDSFLFFFYKFYSKLIFLVLCTVRQFSAEALDYINQWLFIHLNCTKNPLILLRTWRRRKGSPREMWSRSSAEVQPAHPGQVLCCKSLASGRSVVHTGPETYLTADTCLAIESQEIRGSRSWEPSALNGLYRYSLLKWYFSARHVVITHSIHDRSHVSILGWKNPAGYCYPDWYCMPHKIRSKKQAMQAKQEKNTFLSNLKQVFVLCE